MNGKRAPKNGTLAEIVEADEDLEMIVGVKGADAFEGLWIPISQKGLNADAMAPPKKRKGDTGVTAWILEAQILGCLLGPVSEAQAQPSVFNGCLAYPQAGDKAGEGLEGQDPINAARRKIKRWNEVETSLLIELVKQFGKGKWKRVLELGVGTFDEHRTTVDLKDKWRNLERSGNAPWVAENPDTKGRKRRKSAKDGVEGAVPPGEHMLEIAGSEVCQVPPALLQTDASAPAGPVLMADALLPSGSVPTSTVATGAVPMLMTQVDSPVPVSLAAPEVTVAPYMFPSAHLPCS